MLPLIVIGATEPIRAALEPYAQVGHIEHHPTAEDAHRALGDSGTPSTPADTGIWQWCVHAAYGPEAYGPIVVGGTRPGTARLAHSGHTLVLGWNIDPDPGAPRRVRGQQITGSDPDTLPWQVAVALSADQIVDLSKPAGLPFLISYLEWKSTGVCQS
jgi:hypothetical protein